MSEHKTVKLSESPIRLRPDGTAAVLPSQGYPADAWQAGEVLMTESSRHGGERHLDGDELVYLVSGSAHLSLDQDDGDPEVVGLEAGHAFVVPRGTWHRLLIDEPSRLLFVGTGRTEVRPPGHSQ
ncbi:MAG: cupin domain-containing protein [Actinobacteria bacterium]|nr:MAG: cupin domain-containing protein [Actinomycetota bacterium]